MSIHALQEALRETMEVVELGDQKHGTDAWREKKHGNSGIGGHINGAQRHINKHRDGECREEDNSKMRHLAHAAARLLIALQLEIDESNDAASGA